MAEMAAHPRAIVLLSGGLDSATAAAIARDEGTTLRAHGRVRPAARRGNRGGAPRGRRPRRRPARRAGRRPVGVRRVRADRRDRRAEGPRRSTARTFPSTYVPARNTVFLSLALAWAEVARRARHLHRRQRARLLGLSRLPARVHRGVRAHGAAGDQGRRRRGPVPHPRAAHSHDEGRDHPRGQALGVDYGLTHSCYDPGPDGRPCGHCDSCLLRAKGFAEAGVPDPALT